VESFVIVLGAVSDGGFHGLAVLTERSFETKRNQFLYSYIRGGDSVEGRTTDTERAAGGKSQGRGNAKGGNGELHVCERTAVIGVMRYGNDRVYTTLSQW
jgi:hypothetical protein